MDDRSNDSPLFDHSFDDRPAEPIDGMPELTMSVIEDFWDDSLSTRANIAMISKWLWMPEPHAEQSPD